MVMSNTFLLQCSQTAGAERQTSEPWDCGPLASLLSDPSSLWPVGNSGGDFSCKKENQDTDPREGFACRLDVYQLPSAA